MHVVFPTHLPQKYNLDYSHACPVALPHLNLHHPLMPYAPIPKYNYITIFSKNVGLRSVWLVWSGDHAKAGLLGRGGGKHLAARNLSKLASPLLVPGLALLLKN